MDIYQADLWDQKQRSFFERRLGKIIDQFLVSTTSDNGTFLSVHCTDGSLVVICKVTGYK